MPTSIFSLFTTATTSSDENVNGANTASPAEDYSYLFQPILQQSPQSFWSSSSPDAYPSLRRLATKYLGIPATSASVERLFSVAGAIIRARRSRLAPAKSLFSLNSSVMDDNYDTYKTANIEINQLFFFF
jgi:hypothetical protein